MLSIYCIKARSLPQRVLEHQLILKVLICFESACFLSYYCWSALCTLREVAGIPIQLATQENDALNPKQVLPANHFKWARFKKKVLTGPFLDACKTDQPGLGGDPFFHFLCGPKSIISKRSQRQWGWGMTCPSIHLRHRTTHEGLQQDHNRRSTTGPICRCSCCDIKSKYMHTH